MRTHNTVHTNYSRKPLNFGLFTNFPKISEWFYSLEGEGNAIGEPSLYIRLSGCYSAKCSWCDSKYSWYSQDGENDLDKLLSEIKETIKDKEVRRLTITGGEPLHFIKFIPELFERLIEIVPDLNYFGIESNGNLLGTTDNVLSVLKTFNQINLKYNIDPTLTISPKMDAHDCYNDELSQTQIDSMYNDVVNNCQSYLGKHHLIFKFVYDINNEISNERTLVFIEKLKQLGFENKNILLMPWTPLEPLGNDAIFWEDSQNKTARKSLEIGVRYSPRLHVNRQMD